MAVVTYADYIWTTQVGGPLNGALVPVVGLFVRIVNNVGGATFIAAAPTNAQGYFSIANVAPGSYTVSTGPTGAGPWTPTGQVALNIPDVDPDVLHIAGAEAVTGQKTFTANPLLNVNALPESAITGLIADLSGLAHIAGAEAFTGAKTFNADAYFKSGRPWFDVRAYGAVGDGVADDTVAIQAAITAAGAGVVYFPSGLYLISTLTYGTAGVKFVGAGARISILKQKTGTSDFFIKDAGAGFPFANCIFEDLGFDGSANASNTGGLRMRGTTVGIARRLWMNQVRVVGILVTGGGVATTGDVNNITIEQCDIENGASAGFVHIRLQVTGANAKADDIRIINNRFSTAYGQASIGILSDLAPAGQQGIGGCYVAGNSMEGVKFPLDVNWQNSVVIANFFECTGVGEVITIRLRDAASWINILNVFIGNTYASQGVPANTVFLDDGAGPTTSRIGEAFPSNLLVDDRVSRLFRARQLGTMGPAPTLGALQAGIAAQVLLPGSTDSAGVVHVTTAGAGPPAAGAALAVLQFAASFSRAPSVVLTSDSGAIDFYTFNKSGGQVGIATLGATGINQDIFISYICVALGP